MIQAWFLILDKEKKGRAIIKYKVKQHDKNARR